MSGFWVAAAITPSKGGQPQNRYFVVGAGGDDEAKRLVEEYLAPDKADVDVMRPYQRDEDEANGDWEPEPGAVVEMKLNYRHADD